MNTHTKNQAYVTETLKFRAGSLGGLAHQEVQFKAPEKSNAGSPYVKVDCWDENAVKSVVRLIAAAPDLLQVARDFLLLAALHDWEGAAIDFAKATLAKAEGVK
jgi:hypothetical protein